VHGFLSNNGSLATIDFPGAIFSLAADINPEGTILGQFVDTAGMVHGFLLSK
jgi:hypothetical protein